MGHTRKRKSVPTTRKTLHQLPHIDLLEDSNETTKDSEHNVTEEHLNDDTLLVPDDGRVYISSDNEDETDMQRKDTEEEESNVRKKIS